MNDVHDAPISTSCTPGETEKFEIPFSWSSTIQIMSPALICLPCVLLPLIVSVVPLPNLGSLPKKTLTLWRQELRSVSDTSTGPLGAASRRVGPRSGAAAKRGGGALTR